MSKAKLSEEFKRKFALLDGVPEAIEFWSWYQGSSIPHKVSSTSRVLNKTIQSDISPVTQVQFTEGNLSCLIGWDRRIETVIFWIKNGDDFGHYSQEYPPPSI